ncbi:transcription termination/antitermination protein NusG [Luteolibacter sp. AS25]|uniref:transcription termination/antitermination protein NusG n=1 Tax=Luteolibacter sp. AS25 TaxID=3135776 RepID=UPI00398AF616
MTQEEKSIPRWFCVRTQTKREHIAAKHLQELENIEVFCPRIKYKKATRRGKIWWLEPLFPGYVLAKFDLMEMERAVMFSQGVRGLVRFGSEIPDVPEDFVKSLIDQVQSQIGDGDDIITLTPKLDVGDEIEVATGPFQGMKGTVHSIASATERVKVLLEFLGSVQPVSLDLFSILLPSKPSPDF